VRRADLGKQVTVRGDRQVTAQVVAGQPEAARLVQARDVDLVDARGGSTHERVALVTHIDMLAGRIHRYSDPETRLVPIEVVALEKGAGRRRILGEERP
jgi:hypothetical protein